MENQKIGMGWLPDYPDFRDYTLENEEISRLISPLGLEDVTSLPQTVDLRNWCSPIRNQGQIGSSAANAVAGIVEYFENRAFGKSVNASRLFLYKVTRILDNQTGDRGASLRSTLKALVLFGVPPEKYYPYTDKESDFDREPSAFSFSYASNYRSMKYIKHDQPNLTQEQVLENVKKCLAAGIPSMFGFTVYDSISQAVSIGNIPFPCWNEDIIGGHAVVAVGYNDTIVIKNQICGTSTQGALLIRNSWGESWGNKGYGWLPYDYIRKKIAIDFWSILSQYYVDTGIFRV